jgi:hypothetical protein
MTAVDIARLFLFVREAEQNRGLRVEAIQHWSTGEFGDSWCAEFATMVLDLLFQGESPIPRLSAAQAIRDVCAKNGQAFQGTPMVGDLYFYVDANDHAHHVGFVTQVSPLMGISGNTSADGTSDNGDGVHEHAITATYFGTYTRP